LDGPLLFFNKSVSLSIELNRSNFNFTPKHHLPPNLNFGRYLIVLIVILNNYIHKA
jgi:hypothetical protein